MIVRCALVTAFIASQLAVRAQDNWKLDTEKEGIKIYKTAVPDSKVKAVRVIAMLDTDLSQLVSVLMDVNTGSQWVYHTKSSVLIKKVSPSELYYYSEVDLPWPCENRDFVAHLTVTQDARTKAVTIDGPAVPGYVPLKHGIVRIGHSKGKWILSPVGNKVKVEYTLQVDPGGAIPAWLVNMFAAQGPLESFRKLKAQLKKPTFQGAKLSYIQD